MCGLKRYCELAKKSVSKLEQAGTPCSDDHELKKNVFEVVGELALVCAQIVLTCLYFASLGRPDIFVDSQHICKGSHEVEQILRPAVGIVV